MMAFEDDDDHNDKPDVSTATEFNVNFCVFFFV